MLTEEQITSMWFDPDSPRGYLQFARAIESAVRAELVAASPLTDEQCDEFRRLPGTFNDMIRAIYEAGRASKAAEYADVPPEKFKMLYRATSGILDERTWTIDVERALGAIDKGTYDPKIGGEA